MRAIEKSLRSITKALDREQDRLNGVIDKLVDGISGLNSLELARAEQAGQTEVLDVLILAEDTLATAKAYIDRALEL